MFRRPPCRPCPLAPSLSPTPSASCSRPPPAAPTAPSSCRLKGNAANAVCKALLDKGLVREIRARGDLPAWRRDADTDHGFALVATKAGRAAVPEATFAKVEQSVAAPAAEAHTTAADAAALPVNLQAVAEAPATSPDSPRAGSKLAEVIALLGREQGTSVAEVMNATGWLPHTTRAALSGLRKRGYALTREAGEGGPRYRIESQPAAAA